MAPFSKKTITWNGIDGIDRKSLNCFWQLSDVSSRWHTCHNPNRPAFSESKSPTHSLRKKKRSNKSNQHIDWHNEREDEEEGQTETQSGNGKSIETRLIWMAFGKTPSESHQTFGICNSKITTAWNTRKRACNRCWIVRFLTLFPFSLLCCCCCCLVICWKLKM